MITVGQRRKLWRLDLTHRTKVLVALICDVQNLEKGRCTMSLATLATETGSSRSGIVRSLAELRGRGLEEHRAAGVPTSRTVNVDALIDSSPPEPLVNHLPESLATRVTGDPGHPRLTPRVTGEPPPESLVNHLPESLVNHKRRELNARMKSEKKREVAPSGKTDVAASGKVVPSEQASLALVADPPKPAKRKPRKAKAPSKTAAVWAAYSEAYEERYRVEPVRNARVNGQLSQLLKRIGEDEAPDVARFFVEHNGRWYVTKAHPVGALLDDAEKLRMEWATNRRVTAGDAKNAEAVDEFAAQSRRIEERLKAAGIEIR